MKGRKKKPVSEVKSALVSTFIDIPTKAELDHYARLDDSSLSRLIRQAISEYVDRRKTSQGAAA